MNKLPRLEDLLVFTVVARKSSFAAAAAELGVSPAYITKRIQALESVVSSRLLHRTTRRVTLTESGGRVYRWARRVLEDADQLMDDVETAREEPRGAIQICSSFGFGRNVVAPALSQFSLRFPQIQVRFEVFDRLVDIAAEGFDLDIRVGDEIAPQFIARPLAPNYRVLCASPSYLERCGRPASLADLAVHDCLVIKERDHPFGVWRLSNGSAQETVKVSGPLSTNHGEMAVQWALDGRGIVLRSIWDVGPLLRSGALIRVLPEFDQPAGVWAVYPSRLTSSRKLQACVTFLEEYLHDKLEACAAPL